MARGWESKSVADQMDEAEREGVTERNRSLRAPQQRERLERLESLRMSRARVLDQLERARNSAHRTMLNAALRKIENDLDELKDE